MNKFYKYIVIGGGIAGVTCVETLSLECKINEILLITASPLVKVIRNCSQITKVVEQFDVVEENISEFERNFKNVAICHDLVDNIDFDNKIVYTQSKQFQYQFICICTGAKPKIICENNPFVIGIRDVETVQSLKSKLLDAKRVMIVGNGGIATELAYELKNCEVIWAIKDSSITSTFVDAGAAEFFLSNLFSTEIKEEHENDIYIASKRLKYGLTDFKDSPKKNHTEYVTIGSALGPDWSCNLDLCGNSTMEKNSIHIEYNVEIEKLSPGNDVFKQNVCLTNSKSFLVDLVISATGVSPNTDLFKKSGKNFQYGNDDGVKVNKYLQTGVDDVYAAGDVINADWELAELWLQMRLWTQAKQTGYYAAKCMLSSSINKLDMLTMDFCFELFAHATNFFGYKVILLGKFNGQGYLKNQYEVLLRITKNKEYVKVILKNGRMKGAILIGETDLEETFENLILNETDLTRFGDDLLNGNIDIEDYFD